MGAPIDRDARKAEPAKLAFGRSVNIVANTEIVMEIRIKAPFQTVRITVPSWPRSLNLIRILYVRG